MAATGFTPIKLYASSTASAVPLAANLDNTNGAELAINTNDGKLFYKDSSGVVQTMASKATGSIGGSTTQVQFNNSGVLGGSASLTWSGTVLTSSGFSGPLNGTVGATTPASGAFTTLTTSSTITDNGGTANGVTYLNGSKVVTSGSALTFDGTNFATTGSVTSAGASNSGNLTFTGTGNRITGDFSNSTVANRVLFQSSTTNTNTVLGVIPNGTATTAALRLNNSSDPTNTSFGIFRVTSSSTDIESSKGGTGTFLPFTFWTSGSEMMRLDTSGNLGIGTTSPSKKLEVANSDALIYGITVGRGAGAVSTNTAVGASALANNTTGADNNAFGTYVLAANTTGYGNVGFGGGGNYNESALRFNTTGIHNSAFGIGALSVNTTGSYNVAIGRTALYVNTGSNNTAVGNESLRFNTTASNNTAVGYQAGYSVTTGSPNSFFGYQAGYGVTTGTDNVFIGNQAGYNTTATTTGSGNTYIGSVCRGSAVGNNREIVIGFNVAGQGTNTVTLGSDAGKIYNSFTVNATWTQTSDGRMKTNVVDDVLGLSFINRLRPVTFTWKPSNELAIDNPYYSEENRRDTKTVIHGLIAQEVKAALDAERVSTFAGWNEGEDGIQAISREMFISPLIKAVQELTEQVNQLKAEIAALKGA